MHRRVFKDGLNRGELLGELGISKNRMYLVVADTVQANGFLATFALEDEMMLVLLIIRDHALAHWTEHWLRHRHVP